MMLTQEALKEQILPLLFKEGEQYEKYRKVFARPARKGEEIRTITADGLETINKADEGDFVVQNQTVAKEAYILKPNNFNQRYTLCGEGEGAFKEYRPKGEIMALEMTADRMAQLKQGTSFYFEAPWGTEMILKTDDYIVCPLDGSEVYRIARHEFFETYRLKII